MFRNPEDGGYLPSASSRAPQESFHGIPQFFKRRFSGLDGGEQDLHPDDDMSDDGSQMLGEKKRRLNLEQVKALEKCFELGNKLEPERKMQLARHFPISTDRDFITESTGSLSKSKVKR